MAERKPRATKEESIKAKIENNLQQQAKLVAKIEALKVIENGFKQELADLGNEKKKAERAAAAKAKKLAKQKAEKELLKAIKKTGLSMDDVKQKLGI